MSNQPLTIDCLQYCNWSREIFAQMNEGRVSAVHVTIVYWESTRETLQRIGEWNRRFQSYGDLIIHGKSAEDVEEAHATGKTAIIFGFQHCSPIEEDIDMVEIFHTLGVRFMQLTYNNQSVLATGCYEDTDSGVTRFGKQAIAEMNRVGMVVDMSHSAERSTLEAIEHSSRPIAITHANPAVWHPALRNKSDDILNALSETGGMLGFSMYPHHLDKSSDCTLESFCAMIAQTADKMGIDNIGFGSDLCQNQPDSIVEWMRNGRWSKVLDFGEGSKSDAGFPPQPAWFKNNTDFPGLAKGLANHGFKEEDVAKIMGGNWLRFYRENFGPA